MIPVLLFVLPVYSPATCGIVRLEYLHYRGDMDPLTNADIVSLLSICEN